MVAINACKSCGSTKFHTDYGTGEIICECGMVAEESRIVSEVNFSETSGGKAVVTGQYVSHDQTGVLGNSIYGIQSGESRHQTIEKARKRLEQIGHGLQIPEHVVEASLRHFRTALTNNFVKGRKSQHVLCACLYLACRQSRTDHMLMDFAEAINVNVFYIGATYLQLIRNQKIRELPIVDPTVYIQRFAAKLQFGNEDGRKVVEDARRLVQRMSKDWLQHGRRPAGIAAACILLAARIHNFRRSKTEVVQVAKIAEETLQRRLDEFSRGPAGKLTISDFQTTKAQTETEGFPPSYVKHREREHLQQLRQSMEHQLSNRAIQTGREHTTSDDTVDNEAIEAERRKELVERIQEEEANLRSYDKDETGTQPFPDDPFLNPESYAIARELDQESQEEIRFYNDFSDILNDDELEKEAQKMALETPEERDQNASLSSRKTKSQQSARQTPKHDTQPQQRAVKQASDGGRMLEDSEDDLELDTDAEEEAEVSAENDALGAAINEYIPQGPAQKLLEQFRQRRDERKSAEMTRAHHEALRVEEQRHQAQESLSDLDDEEIDSILLNEEEIEIKSKVWMSINKDYLIEQERKRLRKEADAANGIVKPHRKRRKTRVKRETGDASTAGASAANMLKEKVHSKKINYAAVKELFSK